jgi:predicted GNAT superfamily acetyltransferase
MGDNVEIRECTTLEELAKCVELQRGVFALPDIEISPVRHLIVTKNAGGFTLGAFSGGELVGFVLSVPAFLRGERAFYSHMTGVRKDFQSRGVGAALKWAQRHRALAVGVRYVKWTFEPWKARNAFFNLEKLGAIVREYQPDYYGIDYDTVKNEDGPVGLASDRLFAEWDLESEKVRTLAVGEKFVETRRPTKRIEIPGDWSNFVKADPQAAVEEQLRVRREFESAFGDGLICAGFERDEDRPDYQLFKD